MDNKIYWIWLQDALGYCANIYEPLLYFGSPKKLYEAGENEWRSSALFDEDVIGKKGNIIKRLCSTNISKAEKTLEICSKSNISVITPVDSQYPDALKSLLNFPAVLYVKGDISCLDCNLTVAVVGTRNPSDYGVRAANEITLGLSQNGVTIVSGGATGIDSVANDTAIQNDGKTVVVMGCGLDENCWSENQKLYDSVCEHGALITEYQPDCKATFNSFNQRNRIISGISNAIVVIEAGIKSGTLNMANHAKQQGKEVFAVSGDIYSSNYAGSNKLISQGARVVYSANDILSFYKFAKIAKKEIKKLDKNSIFNGIDSFEKEPKASVKAEKVKKSATPERTEETKQTEKISKKVPEGISKNAEMVYNIISSGNNQLDDIVRKSALAVNKVLTALTELEIMGYVQLSEGNKYILN